MELIFLHKIYLFVGFPIPPVWGQSSSCSRSYAHFTEEWSVCLARGSCREEEHMSIDAELLTSIDMDARTLAEHILWLTERGPSIFMCFLSHCWRLSFLLSLFSVWRERRNSFRVFLELYCVGFILYMLFIYSFYDFCDKVHVWIDPPVRSRVQIG